MGRDSGRSSIRGSRRSKWGACFQQMALSLKCQACWVWCPNSCVREGKHKSWTHTHTHTQTHTDTQSCLIMSKEAAVPGQTWHGSFTQEAFYPAKSFSAWTVTADLLPLSRFQTPSVLITKGFLKCLFEFNSFMQNNTEEDVCVHPHPAISHLMDLQKCSKADIVGVLIQHMQGRNSAGTSRENLICMRGLIFLFVISFSEAAPAPCCRNKLQQILTDKTKKN